MGGRGSVSPVAGRSGSSAWPFQIKKIPYEPTQSNGTEWGSEPATEKQLEYISSFLSKPEDRAFYDVNLGIIDTKGLTKAGASTLIDDLKEFRDGEPGGRYLFSPRFGNRLKKVMEGRDEREAKKAWRSSTAHVKTIRKDMSRIPAHARHNIPLLDTSGEKAKSLNAIAKHYGIDISYKRYESRDKYQQAYDKWRKLM